MAKVLVKAAMRGVKLVIETHSALLLREIQTMVVRGEIPQEDVILHWFQRDPTGATEVTTASVDEYGAYGKWPQDFDITELESEKDYLNAIEFKGNA